jgi:hypothetical protein
MDKDSLLVPVYLNQRIVFDLIAMLQGGISAVTTVTKLQASKDETVENAKASFGLSNALSALLKINLSGEKSSSTGEDTSEQTTEDRVHTPASLFYMLRSILIEKNQVLRDEVPVKIKPGDLIEFEAFLKRNPIIETIEAMAELMDLASVFTGSQKGGGKSKRKDETTDFNKIKKQMISFTGSLKTGDSIDLTTSKLKSGHKAILTLEIQFLNDPMMSDLIDGKFKVLGKVIRSIDDENDSISLIRKTAMSKGFNIPKLEWEVKGPVIQVIPISIFA